MAGPQEQTNRSKLLFTWLKGRLLLRSSDFMQFVSDPRSVSIVAPNKALSYPSSVDVIAIVPHSCLYKRAADGGSQETGDVKNLEVSYPEATLAYVDRATDYPRSPTDLPLISDAHYHLHVSRLFLSEHGFKDGDVVWFRNSRVFPLKEVYLEHIYEGDPLTEDTCTKFIQHIRQKCNETVILAKQEAQFRYDLREEKTQYLHLSIGNMMSKNLQSQKSHTLDQILTFSVLMTSPLLQGEINEDTEIYVIPSTTTVTPSSVSPAEDSEAASRGRFCSGSYHLQSGLQRPILSPSPDADDCLRDIPSIEEPTPDVSYPVLPPFQTRQEKVQLTQETIAPLTPPVGTALSTSKSTKKQFFGESSSYAIEVQPFFTELLDKNTILIPKTFEVTLSSWLGPLSSADYVAIYPADNAGKRLTPGMEKEEGSHIKELVLPYHAVVKFFSPVVDYYSADSTGSISSIRSGSWPALSGYDYPVVTNLELPVAFLHPESLFSIFPHPRPPWDQSPQYISLEHVNAAEVPCISDLTISLISEDIKKFPSSVIGKPVTNYLITPRCVCLGEVFSVMCGEHRVFFKITQLFKKQKGVSKEVSFGTTMQRTDIHYSSTSVSSFIPNLSYLAEFGSVYGLQYYWDLAVPLGLEEAFHHLLAYCLPMLERGVSDMGIANHGILLSGPSGCGKMTVIKAVAKYCHMTVVEFNCADMLYEYPNKMPNILSEFFKKATERFPCFIVLRQLEHFGKEREYSAESSKATVHLGDLLDTMASVPVLRDYPIIVMGTTSNPSRVSSKLSSFFLHEFIMQEPSQDERRRMLIGLCYKTSVAKDVDFQLVAKKASGLVLGDLVSIITQATHKAKRDIMKYLFKSKNFPLNWDLEQDLGIAGIAISQAHILKVLESHFASQGDNIGTLKVPQVMWEDIGGLARAKQEILDTIQLPLQHPEMFGDNLVRSGILLYGAPGTGKTLLAKAVATECLMNFISVKGPEVLNMYVGQSESNIRDIFTKACSASPCVMFFDELDSLAPNRGKSADSGGVMDRVVSQFLAELDALHDVNNVFVIGATNRPDLIDPSLLRPGRFDRLVYLEVNNDTEAKVKILQAVTRKMTLVDVDLWDVASQCPDNLTGADLNGLCTSALMLAVQREVHYMEEKNLTDDAYGQEQCLKVTREDFNEALKKVKPSVSEKELAEYEKLRHFHKDRTVELEKEEEQTESEHT